MPLITNKGSGGPPKSLMLISELINIKLFGGPLSPNVNVYVNVWGLGIRKLIPRVSMPKTHRVFGIETILSARSGGPPKEFNVN
jgi:hypothetical protein